jgi:hypothetical protein
MEKVFKKYRFLTIEYYDCTPIVCGYCNDRLIGAIKGTTKYSFRLPLDNGTFIEEEYKNIIYNYTYIDENILIKKYGDL